MASAPIHSVLRCSHSFPSLAKDESPPWSCFDDQVPGRWCEVTGGSSACVCLFVRLYACVCRCDRGKSIPTVMREVPTALPSGIEKTFSSLSSVVPPTPTHTPYTSHHLFICFFSSIIRFDIFRWCKHSTTHTRFIQARRIRPEKCELHLPLNFEIGTPATRKMQPIGEKHLDRERSVAWTLRCCRARNFAFHASTLHILVYTSNSRKTAYLPCV